MSALPPRADIRPGTQNVRLVPKADIRDCVGDVRFTPKNGHPPHDRIDNVSPALELALAAVGRRLRTTHTGLYRGIVLELRDEGGGHRESGAGNGRILSLRVRGVATRWAPSRSPGNDDRNPRSCTGEQNNGQACRLEPATARFEVWCSIR